jgi:hypothetical protein
MRGLDADQFADDDFEQRNPRRDSAALFVGQRAAGDEFVRAAGDQMRAQQHGEKAAPELCQIGGGWKR